MEVLEKEQEKLLYKILYRLNIVVTRKIENLLEKDDVFVDCDNKKMMLKH